MPRISAGARETPAAVRNGGQSAETRELGEFEAARFAPDLCTESPYRSRAFFIVFPVPLPVSRRTVIRLRSERWRRAHGIGPRRPAQRPWLAAGVSRSTWYRRRKKARDAATTCAIFARAESFAAALTRDLARCAALERESMAIIAELAAFVSGDRRGFTPTLL